MLNLVKCIPKLCLYYFILLDLIFLNSETQRETSSQNFISPRVLFFFFFFNLILFHFTKQNNCNVDICVNVPHLQGATFTKTKHQEM